ncbi:D-alanyl-D-alanine carboxypeptidase/D-alanyl-D-alanine-endopeptidase [Caenimonas sp. SL110]|uniref:D-alanyl-D-alanine carboxypeptidase/D-alanyl-D-alanine endopeptidase n=1 Tax=Caenimonas sp. SL110 TaxID=1450524 RepID=UPI0006530218|nr:D-alanyl-D-alanine carboxypeptidase/D-alanyl-D-alanine-endopeptidase [Caenimonas sp. SL110]
MLSRPLAFCVAVVLSTAPLLAWAQALPAEVEAALVRAKLPRDAVTFLVTEVDPRAPPRLAHRISSPVNPASVAKLATTYAALELLGPAYTWSTPVYVDGTVRDGTLQGNLYIKGTGDPKLVAERIWLMLRRVQGLGIRAISGDIVLDQSAFSLLEHNPTAFDGEPLRAHNVGPGALLLNYRAMTITFTPRDGNAMVHVEPPLAGVQAPASVPLTRVECGDWRGGLQADFNDPSRLRFAGGFPASCGERTWPLAYADPRSYSARTLAGIWQQTGGTLSGQVRDGKVPAGLAPAFEVQSPPLAEVIRDINKFSNNVMAQQVFLTLSLQRRGLGTMSGSRDVMRQWWIERFGAEPPVFDNGSGLSRDDRITAQQLAQLLQAAWASPLMPDLMSSLPLSGIDGTMRRVRGRALGLAHLKTGSLRDVTGVAGYVHAANGKRYVLVAIANHANAAAVRPAIEALIEWTAAGQ